MWACNRALFPDPEACKQLKYNFQMFFPLSIWIFVWTFFPIYGKLDILEMGEDWDERKVQNEFFPQSTISYVYVVQRENHTTLNIMNLNLNSARWVGYVVGWKMEKFLLSIVNDFCDCEKITPDSRAEKKSHKNLFCRRFFFLLCFSFCCYTLSVLARKKPAIWNLVSQVRALFIC